MALTTIPYLLTEVSMTTDQKTCFKCEVSKPLAEFYRHSMMGDGYLNKCKECAKADARRNYRKRRDYYRAYERERANLPHRVEARKQYSQTDKGKAAHARAGRRYSERYPSKYKAHNLTRSAIRDGRLKRQPCEVCADPVAQAHHDDYSKPLVVRWLCVTHHAEWHRHNTPKYPESEAA